MRLAAKLVLLFLACLALVVAVFSFLSMRQAEDLVLHGHERHALDLAASLRSTLETSPQSIDALESKLASWSARIQYVQIRLVNPRWKDRRYQPLATDQVTLSQTEVTTFRLPSAGGEQRLISYVPLQDKAGMHLEVVGQDQPEMDRLAETLTRSALALMAATLVSSVAILIGGVWMVGKPLERLLDKVHEIGAGKLTHPVAITSKDELGKLGEAINEMCDQLVQQRTRIEQETAEKIAAVERLRHADRLHTVGRLAAGLAHEIGTPLNVVSGRAELIAGGQLAEHEVQSSADIIKSESQRIAGIVRQLLDFARPARPHRAATDVAELLSSIVRLMQPLADKGSKKLHWDARLAPHPATAQIDASQIQQVVTNLVVNAIQASAQPGNIWIDLSTEECPQGTHSGMQSFWRIGIRDDGPGIAENMQENLFEPFYTTKEVGEGTGLGLAVAYGIVKEHDGWIDVSSDGQCGAEFSVYLPHAQA